MSQLEFYISGIKIEDGVTIKQELYLRSDSYELSLNVYNATYKLIESKTKIAFEVDHFPFSRSEDVLVVAHKGNFLHIKFANSLQIFPQLYERIIFDFKSSEKILISLEDGSYLYKRNNVH